jgi:hypothetical protein
MKENNSLIKIFILLIFFINIYSVGNSEIMILSGCKNIKDGFIKNEYILDIEKSLMTRNYIYDDKTFKKYRTTDLSVQKKNTINRVIYEKEDLILTDKIGYPQFYTQLIFEKKSRDIKIKTVINNEEATSKISTCKKIETFEKES